ncbi:glycosyl hydrolase family 109 [Paenibacillus agaridevorans]|uniref:Glycosyl hydrolase family 109 n=1 Tax=Paenibacillus agaridevorans TaxID=171404 RepID=A0A2R5EUP9_9BACL|nr:Gfo/Idh/MocA family oxidoreductase [Paenibacillus agaridevorans]GBG07513.1 glycosyl hydrolase family 109 [Paenibacillus agaridevorans]
MTSKVKIGLIGLGGRGMGLLEIIIMKMKDVEVVAVCDLHEDRRERAADIIEFGGNGRPVTTSKYMEILKMESVDAIVLCTSWSSHIQIVIDAMEKGKYVACEVGGSYSVQECWKLVEAYERTGVPCMMLENCCYGRDELMVLNMVKLGVFGEIVHCSGGYHHDLRSEIAYGKENRHYRLNEYIHRNCENYPTHELGPIAKVLDINKGNRMLSLVSVASKAVGMQAYVTNKRGDSELADTRFQQGDIVTTVIKCARGETITLTLDTTLPRFYARGFTVRGTKGLFMEDNHSLFLEEEHAQYETKWKSQWGNVEQYREKYEHPIWQRYMQEGVREGHDGMDWLVFQQFFDSVRNGTQTPIDVYDMASWMCISSLSEDSIALGGHPVAIPDFTNGKWISKQ